MRSSTLWHSVGFSETFSITVFTSIVNVLVTLVAIALVDKIGRKPLIGSAGMTVTLASMAWCFSQARSLMGMSSLQITMTPGANWLT